jgi:LCP family protein required for cell wall assembly
LSEKSKKQLKLDRAVARHGNIHSAGRSRTILGILGKALVVVIVSTLTVATVSAIQITQELSRGQIDVPGLDGGDRVIPPLNGPLNILLVGSDTRSGAGNSAFGDTGGNLADVIILLHVSANRQNAVALSFPRDTMVPWPACPSTSGGPGYYAQSLGQINATIANGGPGCTLLTVELLTGLNIPYLAMVDFNGVIELSNAVGGVEVCVAQDIEDEYTNTYLKKGMHILQGVQALQFLRTRHGVGDGSDLGRISNQQVYLTSLVRKLKSKDILNNPVALYSLAQAAAKNMTLSKTLSDPTTLMGVANALKDIPMKKITFLQLPSVYGLPAPNEGRVKPDYEKAQIIFDMIKNDEPIVLAEVNNPGVGSELAPTMKPTPKPSSTTSPTKKPTPTPTPTPTITPLPDWAQGTNAQTTTCSK